MLLFKAGDNNDLNNYCLIFKLRHVWERIWVINQPFCKVGPVLVPVYNNIKILNLSMSNPLLNVAFISMQMILFCIAKLAGPLWHVVYPFYVCPLLDFLHTVEHYRWKCCESPLSYISKKKTKREEVYSDRVTICFWRTYCTKDAMWLSSKNTLKRKGKN